MRKNRLLTPVLLLAGLFIHSCAKEIKKDKDNSTGTSPRATNQEVKVWLTTDDKSKLLQKQESVNFAPDKDSDVPVITVDENTRYQEIDGFGFTLTGGSAQLIKAMEDSKKKALLQELFGTGEGDIGLSYLRVSIGASDMSPTAFSYDEMPEGQTDMALEHFSLGPDKDNVIPILKEILAINPHIKILGSPWSAPTWMKTYPSDDLIKLYSLIRPYVKLLIGKDVDLSRFKVNKFIGGTLNSDFCEVYARYFVKYIQEMKANGITIDAVTLQNEPYVPTNNPSMLLFPLTETELIRELGRKLDSAGLSTKIICYDDNPAIIGSLNMARIFIDKIMRDSVAGPYVDGSAFHLYMGDVEVLTEVQKEYPDKKIYFTESWNHKASTDPLNLNLIKATRNWSRNMLGWNLAADPNFEPNTSVGIEFEGCSECEGAVTIDGSAVTRNAAYYSMAHGSKFVRPGAVRINSNIPGEITNVAFQNSDDTIVVVAINNGNDSQRFKLKWGTASFTYTLPAKASVTFKWAGTR